MPNDVRPIDECAQVVRRSVEMRRREKIDAIITPAEAPGKIGDRHHLQRGDAIALQQLEFFRGGAPRPFRGKCANMKFVNDLAG